MQSQARQSAVLLATTVGAALWLASPAQAQEKDDEWCQRWGDRDRGWYCEVREIPLQARDLLTVDAGQNGGVSVRAWNRNDVLVQAKVFAHADTDARARELVSQVTVRTDGRIQADGPATSRKEHWGVSFSLSVPQRANLSLETINGGISVTEVIGGIDFRARNGGIELDGVGGDVRGRTTNGGLDVRLSGTRWDGTGLDVQTTNGGIDLVIPPDYSAMLETGTVNGGLEIDFPITVQGRIDRHIETELGQGGPLVRVVTTNGGVSIRRR